MREYKFRCWDKDIKAFVPVMDWIEDFKNCKIRYLGKEIVINTDSICNLFTVLTHKDVQIMQYTGLKDKNGTEIYEGDIVKHEAYMGGASLRDNLIGPVIFKNGCFAIKTTYGDKYLYTGINKIIGNIYENKYLLGDVK